ncbi:unnamed protein product (macronuclear) [Paramecium tetraurelia]|uniref:non-specific serine/threonine protein kinase n=1 Tax=Paramecium tetraurelia TaxID=5888 RepID=A0EF25_PARTE|nr:uncharacterized protein GSPATT00026239001 [Paramecium tetraurelia]CAK93916.1 unnamed protein product [Paramecium tetraurelia]|eukprot:XP_001461289.1 hypothetical protein (macronuclear) [Paramecium tetraurelia strain d4-2]
MNQNQVLSRLSCKDINDYSFIKMLGTGSYSEVFQGKNKTNGEETAIKVIDKVFLAKQNKSHLIYLESNALTSINHPGVIKCYATYESNTKLYLSLELMNWGTFRDFIKERQLTTREIQFYAAQLVVILEQVHKRGVVHRDVKPENLMMTQDKFIKLIDFGTILLFKGNEVIKEESDIKFCRKSSFCGTGEYLSPELLDQNCCGPQSDLWALGVIIYELFTGKTPFQSDVEYIMFQNISDKEPNYDLIKDQTAVDFIQMLLTKDASTRLTEAIENDCDYSILKQHPFLSNVNFETLWVEQKETQEQPKFERKNILRGKTTLVNDGVSLILSGIVDKHSGVLMFGQYTPRTMQLIQKHFSQELFYYNPYKKKNHQIELIKAKCKLGNDGEFVITSNNKKYFFKQREHPATQWVALINNAISYNKQFQQ